MRPEAFTQARLESGGLLKLAGLLEQQGFHLVGSRTQMASSQIVADRFVGSETVC